MGEWEETRLWMRLGGKDEVARAARDALSRCMPNIALVLSAAGTSPADFTLHDDQHAFRVAERMVDICPANTLDALSGYEIALLLLSAYLHDIGMTPDRGLVLAHYSYLFAGDAGGLTDEDENLFRGWLDENGRGAVPPLAETMQPGPALTASLQLVTHYCRSRHVAWSDRWMASNLVGLQMGTYATWLDDLKRLCASHHEGLPHLLREDFSPRLVATDTVVNLRYLACLLRVADVVEFDPERTPDVVFRQRAVTPSSAIYWHKDHQIALDISPTKMAISARPQTAVLHKAIELTAEQIDSELLLCRDLDARGSLSMGFGVGHLPHEWSLPTACIRDIAPRDEAYEYVDGAFRPDVDRILQLLAGVGLYGSPLAALREMIQNASDAINEQMAWQRLNLANPLDSAQIEALMTLHAIKISVERREDSWWLDCTDSGVGMTKAVITDHLLVSGSSRKREIAELTRLCKQAGFSLRRTGQFGIGVLSYFMIGEEMLISTERSSESKTADGHRWEFLSNGLDYFGELRRQPPTGCGTTVSLKLRDDVLGEGIETWMRSLEAYLDDILVHLPCTLKLVTPHLAKTYGPGWCRSDAMLATRASKVSETRHPTDVPSYYSESQRRELEDELAKWEELEQEISSAVRFEKMEETLSDGLCQFRAKIAYFELCGGKCLAYMRTEMEGGQISVATLEGDDIFQPKGIVKLSWNGMGLTASDRWYGLPPSISLEVDFRSDAAGGLAVNRNMLTLSKAGVSAREEVVEKVVQRQRLLVESWADSAYHALNAQIAGLAYVRARGSRWLAVDRGERIWRPVTLPAVSGDSFPYQSNVWHVALGDRKIAVVPGLNELGEASFEKVYWHPASAGPDRVVFDDSVFGGAVGVWETFRDDEPRHPLGDTAEFPREWQDLVCCVSRDPDVVTTWNIEHPLVVATTAVGLEWCTTSVPSSMDPLGVSDEMLKDRSRAASWLARILSAPARYGPLWQALGERSAGFREQLWRLLFFLKDEPSGQWPVLRVLHDGTTEWELVEVGVDGWRVNTAGDNRALAAMLPRPAGERWNITLREDAVEQEEDLVGQEEATG